MERASNVLKLVALVHIGDGLQCTGQGYICCFFLNRVYIFLSIWIINIIKGIIRSVGGQKYSTLALFIGFYIFGLPIGLSLLLATSLKSYGNFIFFTTLAI